MIYLWIERDTDGERPYIDMPRAYRTDGMIPKHIQRVDSDDIRHRALSQCTDGLYIIEGAKYASDPRMKPLIQGFAEKNPGCKIHILTDTVVAMCPAAPIVYQSVTKSGILPA